MLFLTTRLGEGLASFAVGFAACLAWGVLLGSRSFRRGSSADLRLLGWTAVTTIASILALAFFAIALLFEAPLSP